MMKRFTLIAIVVMLSATLTGCNWTQKFMGVGAVVGAGTGAIWANGTGGDLTTAEGALVGAVTGATAGGLVGSVLDYNKQKELEAEIADLRAQLEKANAEIARLRAENDALKAEIERLKAQAIQMQVSILSDVLFKSGSARLSAEGQKKLTEVANQIKGQYANSYVSVQGHTDTQPIKVSKWDDNWQLGSARSLAVMRFLIKQGVSADRASAETYGETRPIAPNTSPENMQQNRRAVIVVRGVDVAVKGTGEAVSAAPATSRPEGQQPPRRRARRGAGRPGAAPAPGAAATPRAQ